MEQPFYQLIAAAARENGILDLTDPYSGIILAVLAVLGLLTCFLGFYMYRILNGGVVFLLIAWLGRLWLEPRWGSLAAVTFIAVIGVTAAFLAFRWYRTGAVALCAAIAVSWIWQLIWGTAASAAVKIAVMVLAAGAAGALTFFFPVWSIYGFTAVWGAVTFSQMGSYLIPFMPEEGSALCLIPAFFLSIAGAISQYFLFRKQKIFTHIMPAKLEYRLEQRRKGGAET